MPSTFGRRLVLWGPAIAYMGLIFHLSSESDPVPGITAVVWDKLLHTAGYAALGALVVRGFAGERLTWTRAWIWATVVSSAYGASDELHQWFVPGRQADIHDWMADSLGAWAGAGLALAALALWARAQEKFR